MGHIIVVAAKKGGSGKTTVAVNLAGALQDHCKDVLVVDSDPQGTALTWRAAAGENNFPVQVIGMPKPVLHKEVSRLVEKYSVVVIDSPSGYQDETIQRSAMMAASIVIIPVQPSAVDIWSTRDTVKLVEEAKVYNPGLKACLLISRYQSITRLSKEAREALEAFSLPVLQAVISQRAALAEAPLHGKLIFNYANNPAVEEFRALAREILEVINYGKEKT